MPLIPRAMARAVRERAVGRCEYCRLSEIGQIATFAIDHIQPRIDGGLTVLENLALACEGCSSSKADKSAARDLETWRMVRLFHPRFDCRHKHFKWESVTLVPLTSIGRATVDALKMNRDKFIFIRREEAERGRHPPED